jgi:hypothetical protein
VSHNIKAILDLFPDENFLKADGLDEAIIGVDDKSMRLIYSKSKCIEILAKDMGYEDAVDFYYFNVHGSYMGEKTPIWCEDEF